VNRDTLYIALDALRANKVRAALTMLGVIIGVASVILLTSLGEGARSYLQEQFAGMGTNLVLITPGKTETAGGGPSFGVNTVHRLTFEDTQALGREATSVKGVTGIVIGAGTVKYRNRTRGTTVIGASENFQEVRGLHANVGSFFSEEDVVSRRRVAVIGRTVLRELFRDENPLGRRIDIDGTKFRVIGIMEPRGRSLGFDIDDLVFIPVRTGMDLFALEGLNEIIVQARSAEQVDDVIAETRDILMRRHRTEDFTVVSQGEILETFNLIAGAMTTLLLAIASISLLVGGIGIMNIMLVSVRERTREIGTRMAVGATRRAIRNQFLIESTTLSGFGGLVGLLLGVGIAKIAQVVAPNLPVRVSPWILVIAVGFSLAVGVFFGVWPAVKASRLDPIEALRYE
jgi:putative ABC transport system permease protein